MPRTALGAAGATASAEASGTGQAPTLRPAALVGSSAAPALPATADEELGRRIYRTGRGDGGREIGVVLGAEGPDAGELGAATLPCVNCHGHDGRGRPEGGVVPSDIVWEALTKPYGVQHSGGRRHPPYTERLLKRAVTLGLDAAGNPLAPAMPRYRLSQTEAGALVGYLKRLGHEPDPGVGLSALRLGVVLPPAGSPQGEEIRRILDAFVRQVDGRGGVYGRRLELLYRQLPAAPAERRAAVAGFLDDQDLFALVASDLTGAEEEIAELARQRELPVIGPLSARPPASWPLNRYLFYLQPGLAEQAQALVEAAAAGARNESSPPHAPPGLAAERPQPARPIEPARAAPLARPARLARLARLAIIAPDNGGPELEAVVRAARDRCRRLDEEGRAEGSEGAAACWWPAGGGTSRRSCGNELPQSGGWAEPGSAGAPAAPGPAGAPAAPGPASAAALTPAAAAAGAGGAGGSQAEALEAARRGGVEAIVLLGTEPEVRALLRRAGAAGWFPRAFVLGALAGGAALDAPAGFSGRLYVAAPALPANFSAAGQAAVRRLAPGFAPLAAADGADVAAGPGPTAVTALAAAATLAEALTRCGRELSRERLVAALESLSGYETGLLPPLTFAPGRRIGAPGAYVVPIDLQHGALAPDAVWVAVR
ncbi:MAG TPA: ABC transporter substrate-binding protein [Thermoanaerobaculia bacterium]|nr:ABC transporter substrate-binding protein [Thermoanaerobaculia bacterium]